VSDEYLNAAEDIKKLKKELNELSLFVYGKTLTPHGWKVEKYEEIKKLARQVYLCSIHFLPRKKAFNAAELDHCWGMAEGFYKLAKEKQEKKDNE